MASKCFVTGGERGLVCPPQADTRSCDERLTAWVSDSASEAKDERKDPWSVLLTRRMLAQGICDGNQRVVSESTESCDGLQAGFQGDFTAFEDFEGARPVRAAREF